MKRVLFQAVLCIAFVGNGYVKAEECVSCKGTECFTNQFEQMLKRQKKADNLKTSYKNLVNRAVATLEDKEVVAARGELYKAAKKVVAVAQKKFILTPEELAQVKRLGEVLAKQKDATQELTEEEEAIIEVFQLMVLELAQEYPAEKVQKMADREVELFKQN